MTGFTQSELAELAIFDAQVDDDLNWSHEEVEEARKRDKEFEADRLTPQQLRKRKRDRDYHQRNKKRRNAQSSAYAAEHPNQIREYRSRYYTENRKSILERHKAYAQANATKIAQYHHDYHVAHKDEQNAYSKEYYQIHREDLLVKAQKYRLENGDRIRAAKREYYQLNKERINAARRARTNPTRKKRFVEYNGKTQSIAQWAKELGMKRRTLASRLERGWEIERAFNTPV